MDSFGATFKRLSGLVRRDFAILTAIFLLEGVAIAAFYACIASAIAPLVIFKDKSSLHLLYFAVMFALLRFIFKCLSAYFKAQIGKKVEIAVKRELVNKLFTVSVGNLALRKPSPTLLNAAAEAVVPYFTRYLEAIRYAAAISGVTLLAIYFASPLQGIILSVILPLVPLFMVFIGKLALRLNQKQWLQISRLSLHFKEVLANLTFIKLYGLEQQEFDDIAKKNSAWRLKTLQVLKIAFLSAMVMEFLTTAGIAFCAVTLGFAVYNDGFDYRFALFVLLCTPEFFLPLKALGQNFHSKMSASGAMTELLKLYDCPNLTPLQGKRTLKTLPEIKFSDVTVTYLQDRLGFKHLSFIAPAGKLTVLTGPSGSGKSSVLNALCGIAEISSGLVSVNNFDLHEFNNDNWQQNIGIVPQNPHLFFGSLRENLSLGRNLEDKKLINALNKAGAEMILTRFKDGLDHFIGDFGGGISGGELKLIALARADLADKKLLLLDEPISGLDDDSAETVIKAIKAVAAGKTVIIASHHPKLIGIADAIVAL